MNTASASRSSTTADLAGEPELRPVFPVLDTLRAVGSLAVLTTHTAFQSGDYVGHGVWGAALARLDVGVALFFVLSGFLLSRPYVARAALGASRPPLGDYARKRVLRIVPVYVVAVVLALLLVPQDGRTGAAGWSRALLLTDVYLESQLPQGLTQMWSLAAEVAFYALLPALMLLGVGRSLRPRRLVTLLVGLVLVSTVWNLGLARQVDEVSPGLPQSWLPGYLGWFATGIGLALLHVRAQQGDRTWVVRRLRTLAALPGTCWALVAGLLLVAATPLAGPALLFVATPAESVFKNLVYAVVGGLIVLTGIFPTTAGGGTTATGSRYTTVMSSPVLRHLGLISYSVFCIHLVVLHLVMEVGGFELFRANGLAVWGLTLVASLAASEVLYRLVEVPSLRLRGGRAARAADSVAHPSGSETTTTTRY